MKKILSLLICVCMLLSCMPFVASANDEELTTDKQTLKSFGFDIDESAYNTHALKPGTHAVETQNELVITTSLPTYTIPLTYNRFYEFEKTHTQTANALTRLVKIGREFEMKPAEDSMSGLIDRVNGTPEYFVTSSFDPNCSGMKSYTAKVYYSGGMISLAVYPTNSINSGDVKTTMVSSAFFNSDIKMWLVEGLLSVATGDFDGDGNDEIAVYAPDNSDEYNGADHNELKIKIYSYDTKEREIIEEQSIDLTDMGNTGKTCTWNHSKSSSGKCEYYLLPYLSLTADDVNGDGIDDLMAVMNFSTEFNGIPSSTQYTTAQVLDPTTCWASLLEVYEGRQDGNLVNTVLHKPLVANGSGDNSDYRYVIRHANAVVADVTAEGSKEIVIGGRYTKIEYKNATGTTKVNSTRESYRDENYVFANILGYASYDTVKAYPVSQEGAPYKWVTKTSTTDTLRHYVYSANNPIQQPVSLCGYKFNGFGHPDRIFIEGQNFEYDVEADTLAFVEEISPSSGKKDSSTNRWYCKATAANACDDKFGTEILAVTYFNKIDSKEEYYAYVVTVQPRREFTGKASNIYNITIDTITNKKIQTVSKTTTTLIDYAIADSKYHVCVSWGDYDDDSTFIRYENGDTDVYYSKVEPLAIMQAPPLYGELNDDTYLGNSETSFAKSRGE